MGVVRGYDGVYIYEQGNATWQLGFNQGRSCVCHVRGGDITLFLSEDFRLPSGLHFSQLRFDSGKPVVSCSSFCFPEIEIALDDVQSNVQAESGHKFRYQQLWARSSDETAVPIDVYGENLDSSPILIFVYGGFGRSLTTFYSRGLFDNWIAKGYSAAIVHVRGGLEFGRRWFVEARREKRIKARQDFKAALETLHAKLNLSPEAVILHGMSHGALLVAMTGIDNPELARNYVCKVPISDTQMIQESSHAKSWIKFYGDPKSKEWDQYMKQEDPIHCSVRKGVFNDTNWFISSYREDLVTDSAHAIKLGQRVLELGGSLEFRSYSSKGGHQGAVEPDTRRLHELEFWSWAHAVVNDPAAKGLISE